MLVLVRIRRLNVDTILLSLELLQKLAIIVLLAIKLILLLIVLLFRFRPVAIHALSPTIVSARVVLARLLGYST